MSFKELIIKNRSVRGYDRSRLVTEAEMREMIDCARLSASSMSVQPLKFYMTSGIEEADRVTANAKYAGALPKLGLPLEGTAPPAYILICHDRRLWSDPKRFYKDVGICAQSMSLCATEMGLNCLMMGAFNPDKMKEVIGLPDYFEIVLLLAVGKSIEHIELVDVDVPEPPINAEQLASMYSAEDLTIPCDAKTGATEPADISNNTDSTITATAGAGTNNVNTAANVTSAANENTATKATKAISPYDKYSDEHADTLKAYRIMDLMKVQYYREDGVHYAPKRKLEEIIIKK